MNKPENALKIRIQKNSIQFITEDGKQYYKNFSSFMKGIQKGQTHFMAPLGGA